MTAPKITAPKLTASEFDLIETYFAPLAAGGPGSLDLTDDAALLPDAAGGCLVTSVDTVIAGVHFLEGTAPEAVAAKALRVNLSDIAAMGARPLAYLLAISLPRDIELPWLAAFTKALAAEQETFGLYLLGGDTTATPGPLTISITLFGHLPEQRPLTRSGAKAGDLVFLSGSLGDGALGLLAARGELPDLAPAARDLLIDRYERPRPRLALGQVLHDGALATAAMDLSDGLLQDLGHIARQSGVAARIERDRLPLSAAAEAALSADSELWVPLLSGGDDYELLFTVPAALAPAVREAAEGLGERVTEIGAIASGEGIQLFGSDGQEILFRSAGWSHF